jgi:hypothetical protein
MEPRKKFENWKMWYTVLWFRSCNTQLPVAHQLSSRCEWNSSRGYHEISALTLATIGVCYIRKLSHNRFLYPKHLSTFRRIVVPSCSRSSPRRVQSMCFSSWNDMAVLCSTTWQLSLQVHRLSPYCLIAREEKGGEELWTKMAGQRLLLIARSGICLTAPIGRNCAPCVSNFKK